MTQTQMQQTAPPAEPTTLRGLLESPAYKGRFEEILGKRTPQFVSSVLSVGNTLGADCDPRSIVTAAMTAATLDLPVDKNLGFAWIVPYKDYGNKKAQFQMGYKGYIQLGLRTGQYRRMNARAINAEALGGFDEVGEPVIHWELIDDAQPAVGYVFAFTLINGFTKVSYWPRQRVEEHAKKFSKSYNGNSPWKSNFDAMALKTVIKNELARWGILSVEMQQAIKFDQATVDDIGAAPYYPDGTDINGNGHEEPEPDVISEEQRVALFDLARDKGLDPSELTAIITGAGFAIAAEITQDKYAEIVTAITAPKTVDGAVVTEEAPAAEAAPPAKEEAPLDPEEENLREECQQMFEALPKTVGKNFIAGKVTIGKADKATLEKYKADLEKLGELK